MNQRYKNHRLWEELQRKRVLTQPDQVNRLIKFIEDAQGAVQRTVAAPTALSKREGAAVAREQTIEHTKEQLY